MDIPLLVSPQWLHDNLANPNIQVIENGWIADAYLKAHIAGALCTPGHPYLKKYDDNDELTQQVLDAVEFTAFCHELGLQRDKHYIIYDDYFGLFAARFWCVCRHFGVHNISVLDGSWRGWLKQNRPLSSFLETPVHGTDIVIEPDPATFIGWEELQRIHTDPEILLWDTRREGEYTGEEETDNLRRGHVPGALNLVWTDLLSESANDGDPRFLKPLATIDLMLTDLGLRRDKTIITYCQSGIRAAYCILVLELLNYPSHRLYDASMGEWANLADTPLVTGLDPAGNNRFAVGK
ncbi:MAG: rhodanese-like domain-containing protein [Deltaproteobacteria bacterium]|nr:rhodanese-like domain-containing protein [Deltaproteobacteria bacterium]